MPSNSPFPSIPETGNTLPGLVITVQALRQAVNTLIIQNATLVANTAAITGLANRVAAIEATLKRNNIT